MKRWIHKIKRHIRNRKLSKFADYMFHVSINWSCIIGLNPLVYEIIRKRYSHLFNLNVVPDYSSEDYYSECFLVRGVNYETR